MDKKKKVAAILASIGLYLEQEGKPPPTPSLWVLYYRQGMGLGKESRSWGRRLWR